MNNDVLAYRFRYDWRKRAILQVKEKQIRFVNGDFSVDIQEREAWRDANPSEAERFLFSTEVNYAKP